MSEEMTLEEAKAILNTCTKEELRDHAFGDREVYWMRDGKEVAFGYFGGGADPVVGVEWEGRKGDFSGSDAWALDDCCTSSITERNDSTGPDRYQDNACMPGLTLKGVRKELCGK